MYIPMKPGQKDRTGVVYGNLTALGAVSKDIRGLYWECLCICGNKKIVRGAELTSGNVSSCGCKIGGKVIHGHANSPTYMSWHNMKTRCNNPNCESSDYYKERGITYDPAWESFTAFLADMGERPKGATLDRRDNDLGYSKENCRWATPKVQANNRRPYGTVRGKK